MMMGLSQPRFLSSFKFALHPSGPH